MKLLIIDSVGHDVKFLIMGFSWFLKIIHKSLFFAFLMAVLALSSCQTSEKNKEKAQLHLQLGNSYFENAAYPQALSELLAAEKLDSENPEIHNSLGLTYFMRQKYQLAETQFKKALTLAPKYSDCRNNLARMYIELKKYKEAQEQLNFVFDDLTYARLELVNINQGLLYFNQNLFKDAERFFEKAVAAQRDNCLAHSYLGRSVFEQGDYTRAIPVLNRAAVFCQKVKVDEPYFYCALAHYRSGDKLGSIAKFEELIRIFPNGMYSAKAKDMLDIVRKGTE